MEVHPCPLDSMAVTEAAWCDVEHVHVMAVALLPSAAQLLH